MQTVVIVLLVVLAVIIILTVVLALVFAKQSDSGKGNTCNSQSDCPTGFTCTSGHVCKAGAGTSCSANQDCSDGLVCSQGTCAVPSVPVTKMRTRHQSKLTPTPLVSTPAKSVGPPRRLSGSVTPVTRDASPVRHHFQRRLSVSSLDDEVNSEGEHEDVPFDVRSASTPHRFSVSSPCKSREGVYYCRRGENLGTSSPVVDVCSYSNYKVFLLADGTVTTENATTRSKKINNISLVRIASFNGYLFGVTQAGRLYVLSNDTIETQNWTWSLCDWAVGNVTHISATHDGAFLWLQTISNGYLYDTSYNLIKEVPVRGVRRVYGKTVDDFVDLTPANQRAISYPGATVHTGVTDCALTYHNEVLCIKTEESKEYSRVTMVNWKPYYIKK